VCGEVGTEAMNLSVSDRSALADLVHLYAAAVDDRRFGDVVELFTDTAELRLPDPPRFLDPIHHHRGRDGVRSAMAALSAVDRTEHAIVGEVYVAGNDADYALGRITCIAHHWSLADELGAPPAREGVTDIVWHLRYDDEYLLTKSGWRIHGRALTINAIESRPVRRLRPHPPRTRPHPDPPSADRESVADPSAASTAPEPRETNRRGRFRETP
jgi:hypothetical protein